MRAYVREEMELHVVGFYWSSFTRKNAVERVRESCEFGLKSSQIFGFSARFFTDGLRGVGEGRARPFFCVGETQNEGAERAQWICTVEKSCERIIFSNFASIRNRQLLLKIN